MSENKTSETYHGEMIAAQYIIKHLSVAYPGSFESVSKQFVHNDIRLDPFKTSALIEYCNITQDTAYNKLNQFFISQ